jgi:hypothetical protein
MIRLRFHEVEFDVVVMFVPLVKTVVIGRGTFKRIGGSVLPMQHAIGLRNILS